MLRYNTLNETQTQVLKIFSEAVRLSAVIHGTKSSFQYDLQSLVEVVPCGLNIDPIRYNI